MAAQRDWFRRLTSNVSNSILIEGHCITEGLRKRSMIRPQHVVNRRVEINMLLVLANIPSKFDEK